MCFQQYLSPCHRQISFKLYTTAIEQNFNGCPLNDTNGGLGDLFASYTSAKLKRKEVMRTFQNILSVVLSYILFRELF